MAKPNQNASLKIVACFIWRCFCHLSESPVRAFTFKSQSCVVVSCGQSTDKKLGESENLQAHKITKIVFSFFWPKYMNHFWKKFYPSYRKTSFCVIQTLDSGFDWTTFGNMIAHEFLLFFRGLEYTQNRSNLTKLDLFRIPLVVETWMDNFIPKPYVGVPVYKNWGKSLLTIRAAR